MLCYACFPACPSLFFSLLNAYPLATQTGRDILKKDYGEFGRVFPFFRLILLIEFEWKHLLNDLSSLLDLARNFNWNMGLFGVDSDLLGIGICICFSSREDMK